MPSPVYILLPSRPPSLQTKGRGREGLRDRLAAVLAAQPPRPTWSATRLYLRVVWFTTHGSADLDNIAKPIADALRGLVYADDRLIGKIALEKVDLRHGFELSDRNLPTAAFQELMRLLAPRRGDILFIEVGEMPRMKVMLGLPDGGGT